MGQAAIESSLGAAFHQAASEEGVGLSYLYCSRDYSSCPTGYYQSGSSCIAGPTAGGDCQTVSAAGTPASKQAEADNCGVQYRCMDQCAQDFSAACPQGHVHSGDFCEPVGAAAASATCTPPPTSLNSAERSQWSQQCFVSWPCA